MQLSINKADLKSSDTGYSLTPELFKTKRRQSQIGMISSDIRLNDSKSSSGGKTLNYNKLISLRHSKKVYMHFLEILINTPNIIVEEENNKAVALRVKMDPRRQLSEPPYLNDFYSDTGYKLQRKKERKLISPKKRHTIGNFNELGSPMPKLNIFTINRKKKEKEMERKSKSANFKFKQQEIDEFMSEEEIRKAVEEKMRKLESFNKSYKDKETRILIKEYGLKKRHIRGVTKLQRIIRTWIAKKRFIESIRMNKLIKHKRNYLQLKRSLNQFDEENKYSPSVAYYKKYVNTNRNSP